MKAISIRAPWWWAILYHGKDIENRDWATGFRGRVLLRASKWWDRDELKLEYSSLWKISERAHLPGPRPDWVAMRGCGGCIVGSVEIVDCVTRSSSAWFMGKYGFVLRNPIAFESPKPCKGALGFFEPRGLSYSDAELI